MEKLLFAASIFSAMSAHADCFLTTGAADVASTEIALSTVRGAVEANPLGYQGSVAAKVAVYAGIQHATPETKQQINDVVCPLQAGLAGNNLAVAALGASPVTVWLAPAIGIVTGLIYIAAKDSDYVYEYRFEYDPNSP